MKKILIIILLFIPIKVFSISASSCIAMDLDSGRVLYGYNVNEKKLIASITKIMTAIITIENIDINKEIEVTDIVYKSYGSGIYIEVGEKLTIKDLLYGLMLRSGNDAALQIAISVSGSTSEFVYLMNEYASNLKMTNTYFYNPHGLEESNGLGNTSTALDMAKLTRYAMQNETFKRIFKTKKYVLKTNYKTYVWHNKNKLLSEDYITGGKTGFTEKARRTLVSTGSKDNINIVVVTLNDPNDWADHKEIYNNIFNNYKSYQVLDKNNFDIKDKYYSNHFLNIKNDYYLSLKKNELNNVNVVINIMKLDYVYDNEIVGYVEIYYLDNVMHKEPIYIRVKKEKNNKTIIDKIKGWFKW